MGNWMYFEFVNKFLFGGFSNSSPSYNGSIVQNHLGCSKVDFYLVKSFEEVVSVRDIACVGLQYNVHFAVLFGKWYDEARGFGEFLYVAGQ
jgi:hypothetical protein